MVVYQKPIFCVTHPRACSTAFERVFMTRTQDLACIHEPFGDAFYFGPERMGTRYESDKQARIESGFADSTFKTILDRIEREGNEGKRIFIKDIIHYLLPPDQKPAQIAPSLSSKKRGIGTLDGTTGKVPFPYGTEPEPGNPTVVPEEILRRFHFTFLIRDPHSSIPSYYRCTIPPINDITNFHEFYPSEAGYDEVRRVFDYLVGSGQVGPRRAGGGIAKSNGHSVNGTDGDIVNGSQANGRDGSEHGVDSHSSNGDQPNGHGVNGHSVNAHGENGHHMNGTGAAISEPAEICLIDADDLLDNPEGIIKEYCRSVGLDFQPSMLSWDSEEMHARAKDAFEKWRGFHDDAIESKNLKPRAHKKKTKTEAEWDAEWKDKYGEQGAKLIRETVDRNMADYLYLKQFAMVV